MSNVINFGTIDNAADLSFLSKERLHTGFGVNVEKCKTSEEVLQEAGLNWSVETRPCYYMDDDGMFVNIPGTFQNVRREDGKALGTVSGRYKICQNEDAFRFTDDLLGSGIRYTRAGSFRGGRSVWIEAEMPEDRIILGDPVKQYLVFTNTHDGTGAVRVMIAPVRIVCSNALNFFTRQASRKWACVHSGAVDEKMEEARHTLLRVEEYMNALEDTCEELQTITLSDENVRELTDRLFPIPKDPSNLQLRNIAERREGLRNVFYHKDDLKDFGMTAYRFVNAVSDYVTHATPQRETRSYNEALFERTIGGHTLIDMAQKNVIDVTSDAA